MKSNLDRFLLFLWKSFACTDQGGLLVSFQQTLCLPFGNAAVNIAKAPFAFLTRTQENKLILIFLLFIALFCLREGAIFAPDSNSYISHSTFE